MQRPDSASATLADVAAGADGRAVSDQIARHVATARFEHLPPEAIRAAKWSLLDTLGVVLAASTVGDGCSAFAEQVREDGGAEVATVLGFGFRAPAAGAALANASMSHALDFEDAHDRLPVHPSAQTLPAAVALAEERGASGRELLTALAVGTDLTCRLALALTGDPLKHGWYVPPILGAFGAAAAGASLYGFDGDRVRDALSLTLSQATATAEVIESPRSLVRGVRDAFAAHAAVRSVQLAARGVIGFDRPLEGRAGLYALYARGAWDPPRLLDGLGERWMGAESSLKPWPSCRATHPFVDAALSLVSEHRLDPREIESVTLHGAAWSEMLAHPIERRAAPQTAIDAKFSLPFSVGTALVHGRVTLASFAEGALADATVRDLARRVRYVSTDDFGTGHEAVTRGNVEIRLRSGAHLQRGCDAPYGSPDAPLSSEDLTAKFMDCAQRAAVPLPQASLAQVAHMALSLEELDDIRALTQPLAPSAG